MTERLSPKETEAFYDLIATFDNYDAGDHAFDEYLEYCTEQMNQMGGRDSLGYGSVLEQLNSKWEHQGSTVKLTGKVYLAEEAMQGLAHDSWEGPYTDSRGTYFKVHDAEFSSEGICDALQDHSSVLNEDGDIVQAVLFSYGLSPLDLESNQAIFYAAPSDVLHAVYDAPTFDAVAARLHAKWPKHMRYVDAQLAAAGGEIDKLVSALHKISNRLSQECIESEEFEAWILRYLQASAVFDAYSPYLVTFEGKYSLIDAANETIETYTSQHPISRYLQLKSIGTRRITVGSEVKRVEFSLLFDEPTSRLLDEDLAGRVMLYTEGIQSIYSTRPISSLKDRADELEDDELTQGHESIDEDPLVVKVEYEDTPQHPRRQEELRLATFMSALEEAIKDIKGARRYRFRNEDEARAESQRISDKIRTDLHALDLNQINILQVFGGMQVANLHVSSDYGAFSVRVNDEFPAGQPELSTDVIGMYEGIAASIDEMTDKEGTFWLLAPRMMLNVRQLQTPLIAHEEVALAQVSVKSIALVNLDGSAEFVSPHLDMIYRRRAALSKVALSQRNTALARKLTTINQGLMHEHPAEAVTAGRGLLKSIRQAAHDIIKDDDVNEDALDALRQLLVKRYVYIGGEAWIDGVRIEPSLFKGGIQDVFVSNVAGDMPRVVASLDVAADDPHNAQNKVTLLALESIDTLAF